MEKVDFDINHMMQLLGDRLGRTRGHLRHRLRADRSLSVLMT